MFDATRRMCIAIYIKFVKDRKSKKRYRFLGHTTIRMATKSVSLRFKLLDWVTMSGSLFFWVGSFAPFAACPALKKSRLWTSSLWTTWQRPCGCLQTEPEEKGKEVLPRLKLHEFLLMRIQVNAKPLFAFFHSAPFGVRWLTVKHVKPEPGTKPRVSQLLSGHRRSREFLRTNLFAFISVIGQYLSRYLSRDAFNLNRSLNLKP